MSESDALRRAIAAATTGAEQNALAAQLAAADRADAARKRADADLDWAATAAHATLSPVAVYSALANTAATDWLGDIGDAVPDFPRKLIAEASLWYTRLPEAVRADDEEFTAQAHGAARRMAGRLGVHPHAAMEPFMDYVTFVRKQSGSGLPEVQQTIDANNAPAPTPLPPDVFDNFAPEVDPINAGVSGTEDSGRAPLIQEIMAEGGGGRPAAAAPQTPGTPPTAPDADTPDLGDAADGAGHADADSDDGPLTRATAVNHAYTLADYLAARTAAVGEDGLYDTDQGGDLHTGADDARDLWHDHQRQLTDTPPVTREQMQARERQRDHDYRTQRYADDVHEYGPDFAERARADRRPEPARHPGDWERAADASGAYLASAHTGASGLDQIQQTTAPDGVTEHPTGLPTEVMFPWILSEAPGADDTEGQAPASEMAPGAEAAVRHARRVQADQWHGQEWPHAAVQPDPANHPGTTPAPPSGDYGAGHAAGTADRTDPDTRPTYADASSSAPDFVRGYSDGYGGTAPAAPADTPPSLAGPPPGPRADGSAARLSHLLSTAAERQLPDYAAGYAAGTGWKAGSTRIPEFGSDRYEAGLYAGILDNPAAQGAFANVHRRHATSGVKQAGRRIARHASASAAFAGSPRLPDAELDGPYLRRSAGTSTDLDTMAPGTSADPAGSTPFNGPGTPPMLEGQQHAADPAGPAPYNGAPPYGTPAVPAAAAPDPGQAVTVPATGMTTPNRATAFRRLVQANLARTAAGSPLLTPKTTTGSL